jgi:hypothetical protein
LPAEGLTPTLIYSIVAFVAAGSLHSVGLSSKQTGAVLAYYIYLVVLIVRRSVGQIIATTNNNIKAGETAKII